MAPLLPGKLRVTQNSRVCEINPNVSVDDSASRITTTCSLVKESGSSHRLANGSEMQDRSYCNEHVEGLLACKCNVYCVPSEEPEAYRQEYPAPYPNNLRLKTLIGTGLDWTETELQHLVAVIDLCMQTSDVDYCGSGRTPTHVHVGLYTIEMTIREVRTPELPGSHSSRESSPPTSPNPLADCIPSVRFEDHSTHILSHDHETIRVHPDAVDPVFVHIEQNSPPEGSTCYLQRIRCMITGFVSAEVEACYILPPDTPQPLVYKYCVIAEDEHPPDSCATMGNPITAAVMAAPCSYRSLGWHKLKADLRLMVFRAGQKLSKRPFHYQRILRQLLPQKEINHTHTIVSRYSSWTLSLNLERVRGRRLWATGELTPFPDGYFRSPRKQYCPPLSDDDTARLPCPLRPIVSGIKRKRSGDARVDSEVYTTEENAQQKISIRLWRRDCDQARDEWTMGPPAEPEDADLLAYRQEEAGDMLPTAQRPWFAEWHSSNSWAIGCISEFPTGRRGNHTRGPCETPNSVYQPSVHTTLTPRPDLLRFSNPEMVAHEVQPFPRIWPSRGSSDSLNDKTDDVFERMLAEHTASSMMHP
ncbi:hypothetical protein POSPLADRAFT_1140225 [Postia placenta MAD-698-R-SB12]|uniref:Uncharacterized protein n=1 Tax=Postia placenta MAD-698-R-SB12 TaxID=670580 RepID=A0A1X6N4T2_9APHY|nr:hypothetical protein POSPLADRAFT_1140225 [Postia placenta MAD-698-R-SB12]OSX63618.1 hypothetical protein POSPLADRAFT_1140225 [Postia placenta MAD-698-R-SB12]